MSAVARKMVEDFSEDELRTINRATGLSTDYLNHHNEAVMMLDLIGDMPDMIEDLRAWKPLSYSEHFEDSNLGIGPAAIACYETAPEDIRTRFDHMIAVLDTFVVDAIALAGELIDAGDVEGAGKIAVEAGEFARRVITSASAVVNGAQADVFAERRAGEQTDALIEALF